MADLAVHQTGATRASTDRAAARVRMAAFHLLWLVPCLAVQIWFFSTQFQGLVMPDAMDAAQVGRHISDGEGFTTSVIRPLSLALVPRAASHPDLYNAPLFPLVLGVAFNLFGASDGTVGVVSLLFAILTVIMTYRLGSELRGRSVGALAAVLVTLTICLLTPSTAGMSINLLMLLLTSLCYALLRHKGTTRWSLACGAIAGLAYLADYSCLLFAVPACVLVALAQRPVGRRHAVLFVAGFALVILPWAACNTAVTGSPFGGLRAFSIAMWGEAHPGESLYRTQSAQSVTPAAFVTGHLRQVVKKTLLALGALERQVPGTYGITLLTLLGLALFTDLGPAANRLKWCLLAGIGLMGLSCAVGQPRYDFLFGLLGAVAALGAGACLSVLESRAASRRTSTLAITALVVLSAYPIALYALPGSRPAKTEHRNLDYLGRALPSDAVVLTDQPAAVAWYADRTAVWLPRADAPRPKAGEQMTWGEAADATKSKGYQALERAGIQPTAIYLSSDLAA